ncbi:MAG: hypothetical protein KDC38_06630 [Planctomycetes bacterium]|nr:hypothetical protein [Planctomycetota bacterium]
MLHALVRSSLLPCASLLLALSGCFSPAKVQTHRTAIDQQVTAAAVKAAVAALDLELLDRAPVYRLRLSGLADADLDWVRVCLRRRLAELGVVTTDADAPDAMTLEASVEYAGSDIESTLIGFPIYIPGSASPLADVSLYKSTTQIGRARLALLVWTAQGRLLQTIPDVQATRHFTNMTYLTFFGDFVSTDIEDFVRPGAHSK